MGSLLTYIFLFYVFLGGGKMKKSVFIMLLICSLSLCLISCGDSVTNAETIDINAEIIDINTETIDEKAETINANTETIDIKTEYYSLSIPSSWEKDCVYEIYEREDYSYVLSFYDKVSREEFGGGWLFSIKLLTEFEEYSYYPDYDVLGSLEVYQTGSYNVIVTYPTDVQFSEKTALKYSELSSAVPDVIKSISFNDECFFSKEPILVLQEETEPEIVKNFIGKWKDLGIGSRAPDGATRWNVEFRKNGTGTFELIFEPNDIVYVDFEFEPFDTYLGESMEGIVVIVNGGADIRFMVTYSWSNRLQKMLMTMYEVNNNGTPNLDVYWVYANG